MPNVAGANARKQKLRRRKLEEKADRADQQLTEWLAVHDTSKDGKLDIAEARSLFTQLNYEHRKEGFAVKESRLKQLMERYAGDDEVLEADEVHRAVKKYKALLKSDDIMEELFKRHDTNKDGKLQRHELTALLKEQAKEINVTCSDDDVEFVLSRCNADAAGELQLDDLEYAICVWKERAKELAAAPPEPSSACVLL